MSALPPSMRADYRARDRPDVAAGLLIGVWYINPALDPGEEGGRRIR